jgi:iron complex transport system permease protein
MAHSTDIPTGTRSAPTPRTGAATRETASSPFGTWRRALRPAALPLLALTLAIVIVLAAAVGSVAISPLHTAQILLNQLHLAHFASTWPATDEIILTQLRLPRVLGAALVGAALATAGTLFQGLLRNPLADPLLLGTSSGAALGATLGFLLPVGALWAGFGLVAAAAFGGALLAVALVYMLATRRGQTPVVTLLLAGVAVSSFLGATQTLLVSLLPQVATHVVSIYFWLAGGIAVSSQTQLAVVGLLTCVGVAGALFLAPTLDAFALGEEMASHVGVRVERRKLLTVAVASLLVASAVSISGLVGFVGLIAPHACRLLLGPRHRLLIPAAALAGASFVVLADMLARTLAAPSELPLGVLTALVGAPFFLALLRRAAHTYRW